MLEATIIGVTVLAVVLASQWGYRDYSWHKVVYPLVSIAVFGWIYLHDAPTASQDLVVYAVGAGIGILGGVVTTLFTKVGRDATTGKVMTTCGAGFVATWVLVLALRLVFIWSAQNVTSFRQALGEFMMSHQIGVEALPPFFVLTALMMVVSRTALVAVRVARLAPTAERELVTV